MKTELNPEALNSFIIDTVLISPIEKIIEGLNESKYRDCDIKWLDQKLHSFIDFAAKTLGHNLAAQVQSERIGVIMNEYNKNYYIERFSKMLFYFKSF